MCLRLLTYIDINLSATHVGGSSGKFRRDLPLLLSLLDLTGAEKVDFPVVIDELAYALTRELVVGEGQLGGAVAMVLLEGCAGLLDLRGGLSTICGCRDLALDLLFSADILSYT